MKVFLSWSGQRSRDIAEALRDWLPDVLQTVEPWLSSADIAPGSSWAEDISSILGSVDVGILCLTKENLQSQWLLYEAGALSKRASDSLVCPYALDVSPSELRGPLAQFQGVAANKKGTYNLVRALNRVGREHQLPENRLDKSFELNWPLLEERLQEIRSSSVTEQSSERSIEDKVDEILSIIRSITTNQKMESSVSEPLSGKPPRPPHPAPSRDKPSVFIGSSTEGLKVAEAIQLGLEDVAECTIWNQSAFDLARTTIESIVDISRQFDFAILVLTADDMVIKRGESRAAPRDNLLFELGLFTGVLGRARTFLVYCRDEELSLPSDLAGVTAATYGKRSDGNLQAAIGPVCTRIKRAMGAA